MSNVIMSRKPTNRGKAKDKNKRCPNKNKTVAKLYNHSLNLIITCHECGWYSPYIHSASTFQEALVELSNLWGVPPYFRKPNRAGYMKSFLFIRVLEVSGAPLIRCLQPSPGRRSAHYQLCFPMFLNWWGHLVSMLLIKLKQKTPTVSRLVSKEAVWPMTLRSQQEIGCQGPKTINPPLTVSGSPASSRRSCTALSRRLPQILVEGASKGQVPQWLGELWQTVVELLPKVQPHRDL